MPLKPGLDRRGFLLGLAGAGALASVAPRSAWAQPVWTPPEPDRELMVPVRGGRIYVRTNGDLTGPKPPVLFVHGGPGGSHIAFLPSLALASERGVILYDQLDSGFSDRPEDTANWTVERFVSEVDAIRAALNLREFHIVGHSWGGTVALEYGARQPGGLRSVTLGSPLISTKSWERSTLAQLAKLPADVQQVINTHEAAGTTNSPEYEKAMRVFYSHYANREGAPGYLREYAKTKKLPPGGKIYNGMWGPGEIRSTGTLKTYDGEPLLPKLAAPTLVLCGEVDEMTADVLAPLVKQIPDGKLEVIPGAGHGLPGTHAAQYLGLLRPHFARSEAGALKAAA